MKQFGEVVPGVRPETRRRGSILFAWFRVYGFPPNSISSSALILAVRRMLVDPLCPTSEYRIPVIPRGDKFKAGRGARANFVSFLGASRTLILGAAVEIASIASSPCLNADPKTGCPYFHFHLAPISVPTFELSFSREIGSRTGNGNRRRED